MNDTINIWPLLRSGYKYVYLEMTTKKNVLYVSCGNKAIRLHPGIYPLYLSEPPTYLISLSELEKICGASSFTILNASRVLLIKNFSISLPDNLRK